MAKHNKKHKFFAVSATAALVASAIVPVASAAAFTDESKISSWAKEYVDYVVDTGLMNGNADGSFAPQGTFTRAQAAQVIVNYLGLDTEDTEAAFNDVKEGAWYYGAVNAVAAEGLVNGVGGGNFAPEQPLTRQDAAKLFGEVLGLDADSADLSSLDQFNDADDIAEYAAGYIALFVDAEVINGKGEGFDPTGLITRQELAKIVALAIQTFGEEVVDEVAEALADLEAAVVALEEFGEITEENYEEAQGLLDALNEAIEALEALDLEDNEEALEALEASQTLADEIAAIIEEFSGENEGPSLEEQLAEAAADVLEAATAAQGFTTVDTSNVQAAQDALDTLTTALETLNTLIEENEVELSEENAALLAQAEALVADLTAKIEAVKVTTEDTVKVESVNAVNGTITVTLEEASKEVYVENFTVTQAINGGEAKEVTPSKAELSEDGKTVTLTVDKVAQTDAKQSVVYTVNGVAAKAFEVEAVVKELKVESVSAINAKEVTVVFNKEVDKTTAENATNYLIPGKTVTAHLQADKKSVLLTVNTNLTLNTKTSVTVNNVKVATGTETITNQKVEFTPVDTTIPSVVEVKVLSSNKLRVVFSEPVTTSGGTITANTAFKVGDNGFAGNIQAVNNAGQLVGTAGATADGGYKVYELTPTTALPVGTHKLTVNAASAIIDAAGFVVPASVIDVKVEADTTAPQVVSATALSRTQVQVVFNKPVNESTLNSNKFYWNTTGNAVNKANTGITGTVADKKIEKVNDTTYKISFTDPNVLPVGTAYLFNDNTITDLTGNPFPTKSVQLTVAEDPKPEVTKAVALSDKILEVHFNKPVKNNATDGALNKSFYTVKDSAGKVVTAGTNFTAAGKLGAGASITLNAKGDIATIVLGDALPADTYSITVENVKDAVNVALPAAQTVTVTPVDTTPVAAGATLSARTYTDATNAYFVITFPEAMATTGNYSVADKSKWLFDKNASSTGTPATALPADATLSVSADAKVVTIKVPLTNTTFLTNTNKYKFGISNFADKSNNIQTALVSSAELTLSTSLSTGINVSSQLTGTDPVKVTSTKTVTVTLPKALQTVEASDFAILEGSTAYDITTNQTKMVTNVEFVNNANGTSTVTFTLNKDLDLTQAITVRVKEVNATPNSTQVTAIGTIDADGLKLVDNVVTAAAKVDIAPSIQGVSVVDGTTIAVRLDQTMTIANKGDFIVTLDGKEVVVSAAAVSGKYINLTVSGTTLTSSSQPVVKTVAQNLIQSESNASKKVVANTTGLTAKNLLTAGLAFANGESGATSATAAVGDKFTLTFSEAVNPASVGFVAGDKVADGTYAKANISGTVTANASADDTIAIAGVGTITLKQNVTGEAATGSTVTVTATLSADGKTLTFELTNVTGTTITNANFDYATFVIDGGVSDVNGEKFNTTFTPQTSSKF